MEDSINIGLICDEVVPRIPADEGYTHFLITVRSKAFAILYRITGEDAGSYLGEISDKMAVIGSWANERKSRLFCSHDFGREYIKELAYKDSANMPVINEEALAENHLTCPRRQRVKIYEYDYDSAHTIIIPDAVNLDLAVNGTGGDPMKRGRVKPVN